MSEVAEVEWRRRRRAPVDDPHILVCTDSTTGLTTYAGPFCSAYDALDQLADHEAGQQPVPGHQQVWCSIAPLVPADQAMEVARGA